MAFDTNITDILILALTNLNATLARGDRKNKTVNYPTFSRRGDEDVNDFIIDLEKTFIINRIADNRKHLIVISYLKEIAANFYNGLTDITN